MSDKREKILDKIRNLLTLAGDSRTNEHEALNASEMAQKLISKFAIEEAEINVKENKIIEFTQEILETGKSSSILWKEKLVGVLTKVNNCYFIISKTFRKKEYLIFGSKTNVDLVKILFELISNQIEYYSKFTFIGKGKSEYNSFKLGCATRVCQRLVSSKEEIIEDYKKIKGENSTVLVFLNQEMENCIKYAENSLLKEGVKLKKAEKRKVNLKQDAYSEGLKKGNDVVITNNKALC